MECALKICCLFKINRSDQIRRNEIFWTETVGNRNIKSPVERKKIFLFWISIRRNTESPTTDNNSQTMYASNSRSEHIRKTKKKIFQCQSSIFNIHTDWCIRRVRVYGNCVSFRLYMCAHSAMYLMQTRYVRFVYLCVYAVCVCVLFTISSEK